MTTASPNATETLATASARRDKQPPTLVRWWLNSWHPIVFLIVLVIAWWIATESGAVAPYILPSPADTWAAFADNATYLAQHTWVTTYETVIGFVIAVVLGLLVAVIMVYSSGLEKTLYPVILFAQVIPKIAIAPLFIVWLGFGVGPKILVAVLMAFFPIVISCLAGLRTVDPEILELTSTMGASRVKTFVKIRFPASLPQLMSGLKVAATLAVTGAVVGEFVGSNDGLGNLILTASGAGHTTLTFAALFAVTVLSLLLFYGVAYWERFIWWRAA